MGRNADLEALNSRSQTPLDVAMERMNGNVITELLGVLVDVPDETYERAALVIASVRSPETRTCLDTFMAKYASKLSAAVRARLIPLALEASAHTSQSFVLKLSVDGV